MSSEGNGVRDEREFQLPLFIAAAHELKSPLALIRQIASTLERGDMSATELSELARRITLTSERSLRLVQDLTTSQRLDTSPLFPLEPLNPIALCEEVATEISPLYEAKERKVKVRSYRRPPLIVGNRQLLRSILLQFADNALHYTETDHPVEFLMQASKDGSTVRIGVRDRGPAVPADAWERLKGMGQKLQPIARRPTSSGLGLYIARQFAEAMGADIGVTRHRDGASFYVTLKGSTQTSLL